MLVVPLCVFGLFLTGQEICDNGLDDDGDGLTDLNDTLDCACTLRAVTPSLLPNPTFEAYDPERPDCASPRPDGLPSNLNQFNCLEGWLKPSNGTVDAFNVLTYQGEGETFFPVAPSPPPSGTGYAGFIAEVTPTDVPNYEIYREYFAACLLDDGALRAGTDYRLSFFLGFGTPKVTPEGDFDLYAYSFSPAPLALYGIRRCEEVFFDGAGCADESAQARWELLTEFTVSGDSGTWTLHTEDFTPAADYEAVAFGASCVPLEPMGLAARTGASFYFIDDVRLNSVAESELATTGSVSVGASAACDGAIQLRAPAGPGFAYQWYREGVALPRLTEPVFQPSRPGEYRVRVTTPAGCSLSEPIDLPVLPAANLPDNPPSFLPDTVVQCVLSTDTLVPVDLPDPPEGVRFLYPAPFTDDGLYVREPGDYVVEIATDCGRLRETVHVDFAVNEPFGVELERPFVCSDTEFALRVVDAEGYTDFTAVDASGLPKAFVRSAVNALVFPGPIEEAIYVTAQPRNGCPLVRRYVFGPGPDFARSAGIRPIDCDEPVGQITLTDSDTARFAYEWTLIGNETFSARGPEMASALPGTYRVRIRDRQEIYCDVVRDFDLSGSGDPFVNVSPDPCRNVADVSARPNAGRAPFTICWLRESGAEMAEDRFDLAELPPGDYRAELIDADGCTVSQAFTVPARDSLLRMDSVTVATTCLDDRGATLRAVASGGRPPYRYSLDGAEPQSTAFFNGVGDGDFTVTVIDALGCRSTAESVLVATPSPYEVVLPALRVLDPLASLPLRWQATVPGVTGVWEPDSSLSCAACPYPIARPAATTTYVLMTRDTFGCSRRTELVVPVDNRFPAFLPTAFSPNGDGVNDRYLPLSGPGLARIEDLRVYDRFGGQVYAYTDGDAGWDGTVNGRPVTAGVYVSSGRVLHVDGRSLPFRQVFTLIR